VVGVRVALVGGSQALPLVVDPVLHANEIARFTALVIRGPEADSCWIYRGPIGADSYGRFWVRREAGRRVMLRANRYALAMSLGGAPLQPWVRCTSATTRFVRGSAWPVSAACAT
jgi:hypothetical protein